MNKAIKGAVAAGAAGILLLGGAGTFALWNESQNVNAGPVSTGVLDLELGSGAWSDETATSAPISDISTFNIVPGDTLVYTTSATIHAQGDNLAGTLTIAESGFTLPTGATAVIATTEAEDDLLKVGNVLTFATAGEYTVDITLTVTFAADAQVSQNTSIDLDGMALTLQQTA
ncbi:alternate-type signal peptide domain-containing protein [Arthrobacter sp. ZGTC131]|uniref:alternate-type signal peptide domain-containing protein n=1 Tax=Arthrobacter sp. ZGTC131 TaxID=2058898 RepID=UPI000CE368CB|nr:alternate-type signal peptide domain-containing protein [Arthrobacter sp. ZGTC131]